MALGDHAIEFVAAPGENIALAPEAFKAPHTNSAVPNFLVTEALPPAPSYYESDSKEKADSPSDEKAHSLDSQQGDHIAYGRHEPLYVNGEAVIQDGNDISDFIVDDRDDEDPALTFRSFVLGTIIAGLGAALAQIYLFKPVEVSVSGIFLMLIIYTFGNLWATLLPHEDWFDKDTRPRARAVARFFNPGPFRLKEHVVATTIASTASGLSSAVSNFAVQKLFYNANVNATTAVLATFSTACFGYGLVGILRPLTVYPAEMVYWANLPTITVFQSLHWEQTKNSKRLKLFWSAFTGMAIWEIFPAYIFPTLNGISIPCFASVNANDGARAVITNIFGGANGNEGLGLLSFSFDWQYITSYTMSLPLLQQANSWVGYAVCYVAVAGIYYSNVWNSQNFPMISTSVFNADGDRWNQTFVFGPTFTLNQTALDIEGIPHLTGSYVWANITASWSIGGLIAHCLLFWSPYVYESFKHARAKTQPDRHWVAMQKYPEVQWWWYGILLLLSFFAGLIVIFKGDTTLPVYGFIIALLLGTFIAPFSNLLYARLGNGIATNQLMKMVAGALHPGKPVSNLYFSMWSHDVVATSINLASDLKMGQYLKIPPRVMFLTQVWGTLLGAFVNYAVMASIVSQQRETLLDPVGTAVWAGQAVQSLNSQAITWSLAGKVYGLHGYVWVPLGLLLGMIPTTIQYFIWKRWPVIGGLRIDSIILPVIYMYCGWMTAGVNSVITNTILVGVISQVWLRRRYPRWFKKYNYILGGAMDGGAQVLVFILSFAVYGASGTSHPFPDWWGNPWNGNVDHCL